MSHQSCGKKRKRNPTIDNKTMNNKKRSSNYRMRQKEFIQRLEQTIEAQKVEIHDLRRKLYTYKHMVDIGGMDANKVHTEMQFLKDEDFMFNECQRIIKKEPGMLNTRFGVQMLMKTGPSNKYRKDFITKGVNNIIEYSVPDENKIYCALHKILTPETKMAIEEGAAAPKNQRLEIQMKHNMHEFACYFTEPENQQLYSEILKFQDIIIDDVYYQYAKHIQKLIEFKNELFTYADILHSDTEKAIVESNSTLASEWTSMLSKMHVAKHISRHVLWDMPDDDGKFVSTKDLQSACS